VCEFYESILFGGNDKHITSEFLKKYFTEKYIKIIDNNNSSE